MTADLSDSWTEVLQDDAEIRTASAGSTVAVTIRESNPIDVTLGQATSGEEITASSADHDMDGEVEGAASANDVEGRDRRIEAILQRLGLDLDRTAEDSDSGNDENEDQDENGDMKPRRPNKANTLRSELRSGKLASSRGKSYGDKIMDLALRSGAAPMTFALLTALVRHTDHPVSLAVDMLSMGALAEYLTLDWHRSAPSTASGQDIRRFGGLGFEVTDYALSASLIAAAKMRPPGVLPEGAAEAFALAGGMGAVHAAWNWTEWVRSEGERARSRKARNDGSD